MRSVFKFILLIDITTTWQTVGDKQNLSLFSPICLPTVVVSLAHTDLSPRGGGGGGTEGRGTPLCGLNGNVR